MLALARLGGGLETLTLVQALPLNVRVSFRHVPSLLPPKTTILPPSAARIVYLRRRLRTDPLPLALQIHRNPSAIDVLHTPR
jgi:hypothetical protein